MQNSGTTLKMGVISSRFAGEPMQGSRSQEAFGIFLAILGVLFLLVNNHLVWFGWTELWPSLLVLTGLFLLRIYTRRHKPRQLFLGLFLFQFGIFFMLFSTGILQWERMDVLWPVLLVMIGLAMLSLTVSAEHTAPAVIVGLVLIIFGAVSYLAETGAIAERLSEPFVRIWPLVLVAAGVLIYSRAKSDRVARTAKAPETPASPPDETA